MKVPFDLLDSLCSLFLRNLMVVEVAAVFAAISLPRFSSRTHPNPNGRARREINTKRGRQKECVINRL